MTATTGRDLLYKYTSSSTALTVLRTRKLRWSSPLLFNDPFDLTQTLRLDFDPKALTDLLVQEMASVLESPVPPPAGSDLRLQFLHRLLWQNRDKSARDAVLTEFRKESYGPTKGALNALQSLQQAWAETVQQFRILCLSEVPDITPMWHHYADAYKGVVLEFRAEPSVDSALQLARPVIYQDDPPHIASPHAWAKTIIATNGSELHELFRESQYIKTLSWSYEREWRVVSLARAGDTGLFADMGFHPLELAGIYLGPRVSSDDLRAISDLLSGEFAHVSLHRTNMSPGSGTTFVFEHIR